ncbi:putative RNA polymerase sigma factor FecI [Pigmentiphaga humi]|uniref:Putative RNA polymerase sigma factor FecI n=1 Tax=Pigmentiphaga humi TaxID=2478468 RepID=A0A3P4B0F9_9BURK|nr:sigma-70 family RNA polymerase sigma factor [Pigmentiphaga humi]VCU69138.1 putative RNA polymerase sigma factor FecI [Pigmentiphaga humi]
MSSRLPLSVRNVETLYVAHHGWLLNWLRRRLSDGSQAADIAQDAFLRVLASRSREPIAEPRALLARIAKGLMIDRWRRQEFERAYLEALAAQPEPVAPSPETRLAILQALERIDRLLDGLRPPVREAFLLAQLEGLGYAAIAAKLGVTTRSVERYMAQALFHCHLALEED